MTITRRVRAATSGDVQGLLPLVQAYWRLEGIQGFDPAQVERQLTRVLSTPSLGDGWVAVEKHCIMGYLLAVYVFSLEHLGLTAEIDEFYVQDQYRGRNVGSQLLRAAEEEFKRKGCTNVSLQLGRHNEAAREFYRRNGYQDREGYGLLEKSL